MTVTVTDRVIELLNRLGSHPDTMAAQLVQRGIKGKRASERSCPLAVYLSNETGKNVKVGTRHVTIEHENINLDPIFTNFIKKFDNRGYPDLEV